MNSNQQPEEPLALPSVPLPELQGELLPTRKRPSTANELQAEIEDAVVVETDAPNAGTVSHAPSLTVPDAGLQEPDFGRRRKRNHAPETNTEVTPGAEHEDATITLDDELAAVPVPESEPEWAPSFAVSASQASYENHSALGLLHPKYKTPEDDERNDTLGAFAALDEGETAIVRISIRAAENARGHHREWLHATKNGTKPVRMTAGRKAATLTGKFGLAAIKFAYKLASKNQTSEPLSPLPPAVLADDVKRQIEAADHKYSQGGKVFETSLRVAVVGQPGTSEQLDAKRRDIERELHDIGQGHAREQKLAWASADGYDAVAGVLNPRSETKDTTLYTSAAELAPLIAPFDDRTHPHGVKPARAGMRPLEPYRPHAIDDVFNPPVGRMVAGIINPESDDALVHTLNADDLDKHLVGVGQTGSGKSVFIEHIVNSIVRDPYKATVVIDPLGNLGNDLLENIAHFAPHLLEKVVMVDLKGTPEDLETQPGLAQGYSVGFNPLDVASEDEIPEQLAALTEVMDTQMNLGKGSTPRARNYAEQALLALMYANLHLSDENKLTMLHIPAFLNDPTLRTLTVALCEVGAVHDTFGPDGKFANLNDKDRAEHIAPLIRAFQPFETNRAFANVFSSPKDKLDWVRLITERKIVIVKLSALSGQEKELALFIGRTLIPGLLSSMRAWGKKKKGTKAERNRGVRLVIDEAPQLVGSAESGIVNALAVGRQFGFSLLAFSQYWGQYQTDVRKAFINNTHTKIALVQDDPSDCKTLADVMSKGKGLLTGEDIANLPQYHGYAVQGDGGAFAFKALAPLTDLAEAQGITLTPEDKLDELRGKAYLRSWEQVGNKIEDIKARQALVPVSIKAASSQDPDIELMRSQGVVNAVAELTAIAQANIAAGNAMNAPAQPEPKLPIAENWGTPTPTTPNAGKDPDCEVIMPKGNNIFDPTSVWEELNQNNKGQTNE